jgi:hypothetical protein
MDGKQFLQVIGVSNGFKYAYSFDCQVTLSEILDRYADVVHNNAINDVVKRHYEMTDNGLPLTDMEILKLLKK